MNLGQALIERDRRVRNEARKSTLEGIVRGIHKGLAHSDTYDPAAKRVLLSLAEELQRTADEIG